jgi:hypothetical protein
MNLLINNLTLKLTRSIETVITNFLANAGYAANRYDYLSNPAGFVAKQTDIKNRKGFCVDIYGHGSPHDRDLKTVPRLTITSLGFLPGSLGNDGIGYYKANDQGKFDKLIGPLRSSNYRFEVELVSNKTLQDAVMETARSNALPNFTSIPVYDSPQDTFLIQYGQHRNMPELGTGLLQRTYVYEVLDVFENLPITISSEIAKIKEITVREPDNEGTIIKVPE